MDFPSQPMVKTVEGNTDLALQADGEESFLVEGIFIHNSATNHVTVTTEDTTVGYWRVGGTQGNHLFFPPSDAQVPNLLTTLYRRGLHRGYPVEQGQKLLIEGAAQANAVQTVLYRKGEPGKYKKEQPNGSQAQDNDMMIYGQVSGGAADGFNLYDTNQGPTEWPGFPFDELSPRRKQVKVLALAVSDVGITDGTQSNDQATTYLRVVRERTRYYDDHGDNLPILGVYPDSTDGTNVGQGESLFSARSSADYDEPTILDEPLTFEGGENLDLWVGTTVDAGSANFSAGDAEIALLQRISRQR